MEKHDAVDALIVGGGPAGSSCARTLVQAGMRVLVVDRARFPRVKLCAGWLSQPIWDALELRPDDYPRGLWRWDRCHVAYGGRQYTIPAVGYFIRRYEFDDFLLTRSGAEVKTGYAVKHIARDGDSWVINDELRTRYLIGAGGTHCPVSRQLFPAKSEPPVGVQEREYPVPADELSQHRIGRDGEPELLLHNDLRGYAWNISKTDWLNVGVGTLNPRDVRQAWSAARAHFGAGGHLPTTGGEALDHMKGHSYYLYRDQNLDSCERDGAFLVGDALGLAQPLTAEGILPAVLSGRLCGEAIAAGDPARYRDRLADHPVIADYSLLRMLRDRGGQLRRGRGGNGDGDGDQRAVPGLRLAKRLSEPVAHSAIARGFAWMFSGRALPGRRAISLWQRRTRRHGR